MKALESWMDVMHLEKGEPVSSGDEKLCEGSSGEVWRISYESSISVKCGHYFFLWESFGSYIFSEYRKSSE